MSRLSKRLRSFINNIPLDFASKFTQISKQKTADNIAINKLASDDMLVKKQYRFTEGKSFWKHLLDWNSYIDQDIERDQN